MVCKKKKEKFTYFVLCIIPHNSNKKRRYEEGKKSFARLKSLLLLLSASWGYTFTQEHHTWQIYRWCVQHKRDVSIHVGRSDGLAHHRRWKERRCNGPKEWQVASFNGSHTHTQLIDRVAARYVINNLLSRSSALKYEKRCARVLR